MNSWAALADELDDLDPAAMKAAARVVDTSFYARPRTVACTDKRLLALDRRQYATGRGPCLEAARIQRPVRVTVELEDDPRWPEFVDAARAQGVRASVSAPLLVRGLDGAADELVGSLNIYSRSAGAFDPFDEGLALLYALAASMAIGNARRWQQARDTVEHLQRALLSRSEIDQAKGVFRVLYGLDDDAAFTMLRTQSQDRNVKLRDVAREVLDAVHLTERTPVPPHKTPTT